MGQTNVLVPAEAQVGDGEVSQAAGMDDHFARSVMPECRAAAVQRWSRGNGCENRVADQRDVLDTQVLAALLELERMSRAGLLAHLITLYLQEVPAQLAALHEAVAHGDTGRVEERSGCEDRFIVLPCYSDSPAPKQFGRFGLTPRCRRVSSTQ